MSKLLKIVGVLILVMALVSAVAGFYVFQLFQPANSNNTTKVEFEVSKGQSVSSVGEKLKAAGLIKHPLAFRFIASRQSDTAKIQAGSFTLSQNMTLQEIMQELTRGVDDAWITTLEGWRTEEIADMLEARNLPNFDRDAFLDQAKDAEGYLYPDTYQIAKSASDAQIYQLLTDTFEKKVITGLKNEIAASKRDFKDVMVMASIIQREAREPEQMKTVAGILWNRIDAGMGLNVDATLQYIHGYDKAQQTWWAPPNINDKNSTSPFNTYKLAGLPPHPISNPGLDAIRAALNPATTDQMYYLHDAQGRLHYARTLEEHNLNVQKYLY